MTALRVMSPRRVTASVAADATLAATPTPMLRRRLVTAARQGLWRALRRHRGLAPVVAADGARLTLIACYLDGARPPTATGDALAALTAPAMVARWLRQAGG